MFSEIFTYYEDPSLAIGEVVESTHYSCTLSSYSLGKSPRIGEFLTIRTPESLLVGIAVASEIVPQTPTAMVEPLKKRLEDLESIYVDLSERFRDLTRVLLVGYWGNNSFIQGLPPFKPKIHTLVFSMKKDHVELFLKTGNELSMRYVEILVTYLKQEFPLILEAHFRYLRDLLGRTMLKSLILNSIKYLNLALSDKDFMRVSRILKEVI
ncbi:MAG: hypothetical protein DRJ52_06295 [Thermoprotei archaeon]|nr:MAG: hypothetical protein DRJ52_06295 [Thermoprotei archaeon]RLE97691.1 MAG: hypothetical protein DRJ63_08795 [Thermoprotei archaeon]HDI74565.1 hypothetical protein [Thermoprotei archaeon]